ncbi:unnamed protein product [Parajaminaea phylloscopi]
MGAGCLSAALAQAVRQRSPQRLRVPVGASHVTPKGAESLAGCTRVRTDRADEEALTKIVAPADHHYPGSQGFLAASSELHYCRTRLAVDAGPSVRRLTHAATMPSPALRPRTAGPPRTAVRDACAIVGTLGVLARKALFLQHAIASSASTREPLARPWPTQTMARAARSSGACAPSSASTLVASQSDPSGFLPPKAGDHGGHCFSEDVLAGSTRSADGPALGTYNAQTQEALGDAKVAASQDVWTVPSTIARSSDLVEEASLSSGNARIRSVESDVVPTMSSPGGATALEESATNVTESPEAHSRMRASRVPSSRIARFMHYGSLGMGLAWGAAGSAFASSRRDSAQDTTPSGSVFMSESNIRRLVNKLSQMRGAALKLGQFLSIQEAAVLPKEIEDVLRQVQSGADYMPQHQLNAVMEEQLGPVWRDHFHDFEERPFAAASIGQVHRARLSQQHSCYPGMQVAVKVQFPGIKESIESDLGYLKWLLAASSLLPKGLFLESTIRQMRIELHDECDYAREAEMTRRFGLFLMGTDGDASKAKGSPRFQVPRVVDDLCRAKVLVTEMMSGRSLSVHAGLDQEARNEISASLLFLCLSELFSYRLMQTDPNFSNFLYSPRQRTIQLIDFGATREYERGFMDDWLRLLLSAIRGDHDECRRWSMKVGYLLTDSSGECIESDAMVHSHVTSMALLGSPFRTKAGARYDFAGHAALTDQIKAHIPTMLRERKTPPPKETYSLNRKLSGTFLLCSKLAAQVDCAAVLRDVIDGYEFQDGSTVRYDDDGAKIVRNAATRSASSQQVKIGSPSAGRVHQRVEGDVRCFHSDTKGRGFRIALTERLAASNTARPAVATAAHSLVRPRDADASNKASAADGDSRRNALRKYGINLADRWPRSPEGSSGTESLVATTASTTAGGGQSEHPVNRSFGPSSHSHQPAQTRSERAVKPASEDLSLVTSSERPEVIIRGVRIPRRPIAPGSEDCCMSGCARCVYDLYKEDLEAYQDDMTHARTQLLAMDLQEGEWREDLLGRRTASDGTTTASNVRGDVTVGAEDIDPTIQAFLDMERALKNKRTSTVIDR